MASEELERASEMNWQKSLGVGGMWEGLDKDHEHLELRRNRYNTWTLIMLMITY